ncbi:glycosyltransferase [Sphaerospermopsis sp. FACHB-1094]|uniref:glycosyltransferase n=1 Tax=Sphaerospermopsis sp. FACHB-1094 TaxID=2692861 RepID=UPI001681E7C2|nr:glycosyltransferase [Sphaerospermopsis sp. FACHB-1094]MBD2133197.1 glycosyltransferase [Sphaerospermopsis sp. FACHB-1094]
MNQSNLISIVIPVYKSTQSLYTIRQQVTDIFNSLNYQVEIVFVNDSPFFKPTCEVLEELTQQYPSLVREIRLRKNNGQQFAVLIGIKQARGRFIITMDDDLQHSVAEIPNLIYAMENNPDIDAFFAIAPYSKKKHSLIRNLGSWMISKIDDITLDRPQGLRKSSFRILKADIVNYITNYYTASPTVSRLVIQATRNIQNIQVSHHSRKFGRSHYSYAKLVELTFNDIVYHTSLPLAFIGAVGLISFIFSALFIAYTIGIKLLHGVSIPGYTTQVVLISFFGGMTLLGIGIIGEYLVRITKEMYKPKLEDLVQNHDTLDEKVVLPSERN